MSDFDANRLHQRLAAMLNRSAADASYRYPDDPSNRAIVENEILRRRLNELITEIAPYTNAGEAALARLREQAPGVEWEIRGGGFHGTYRGEDPEAVIAALGLSPDRRPALGGEGYVGAVCEYPVSVFVSARNAKAAS
jgi:hypothetical protein